MPEIYFYNTLSRKKELFIPLENNKVKIYTCGPTVYNYVHIGNLRTFLFEDLLIRFLRFCGYEVLHVMNLTDVDDKTIKGSQERKIRLEDFTALYKKAFFENLETLRVAKANFYPEATQHIPEMVAIIEKLLQKGIAYKAEDGSIYFAIKKFKEYGKLSGFKITDLKDGASGRVSSDEYSKEEIKDFVLWKAWDEKDGEVYWETSLGKGRPGWHIECSAMSMKYLGESFDIHCGGIDNMFPHHENEIAQSEAANEKTFVRYWLHSAFLTVNSEKMAKSKKNFYILKDLLDKGYPPQTIRYALISAHYRQPLNFSEELLEQSQAALRRIQECITNLKNRKKDIHNKEIISIIQQTEEKFTRALGDDLNISEALGVLFEFIRKINSLMEEIGKEDAEKILDFLKKIDSVLAVMDFEEPILEEEIQKLIEEREIARKNKDFKKSDAIRNQLLQKGILLKDTKEGTLWQKI